MIEWTTIDCGFHTPAPNRDVVAVSPDNQPYVTTWRKAYEIFSCQSKSEDSHGWKWAYIHSGENDE